MIIGPQTVSRIRDQRVLKRIFASYRSMVLLKLAEDDDRQAADLLATMSDGSAYSLDPYADSASPQKAPRPSLTPEAAAFRRFVESVLSPGSVSSAAAVAAAGAVPGGIASGPTPPPLHPSALRQSSGPTSVESLAARTSSTDMCSPGPEQKIILSLSPHDDNSRAIVERCGFNPHLALSFTINKRTLGSIIRHLALKWFTNVQFRNIPAATRTPDPSHQQQQRDPSKKKPKKVKKPAAVRFGMSHMTIILHTDSFAEIGRWDKTNTTPFSEFLPNLPTSIFVSVPDSPGLSLLASYVISGISVADINVLSLPPPQAPQQQQAPAAYPPREEEPSTSDSIPQFRIFGHSTSVPPNGDSQTGLTLGGLGEDANNIVHLEKSFTSFVLDNGVAEMPGSGLSRQGNTNSQFPLRPFASLSSMPPGVPPSGGTSSLLPSGTGAPAANGTSTAAGAGTSSDAGQPQTFFSSVVFSGASRDGLPREESQLALFPERSMGYSNQGIPFPLGGSGMSNAGSSQRFPLFSGSGNGSDSNF